MVYIKFIVLAISLLLETILGDFCEICQNHVMCLFPSSGHNANNCERYDTTSLLTSEEIIEIVDRINERRNFVAMGFTNSLPPAANMKKITWSPELADFAQRWVDQCDQNVQPDKQDPCRNLRHTEVGQNIATILGPTTGHSVRSYVDIWFMSILKYKGNVAYFNESSDSGVNYFTQLIWADTDSIGCGRAKFYVKTKRTIVERLVCNFAPKGNNHGRPIFTIGYSGTQCGILSSTDSRFSGLCAKHYLEPATKFTTRRLPVSSLLRILNLSNNLTKQEIDPIRINFKQTNYSRDKANAFRIQKTRHIYFNKTGEDNAKKLVLNHRLLDSTTSLNSLGENYNPTHEKDVPIDDGEQQQPDLCPCNSRTTCPTAPIICHCRSNCKFHNKLFTTENIEEATLKNGNRNNRRHEINPNYHDLFPNVEVKSGKQRTYQVKYPFRVHYDFDSNFEEKVAENKFPNAGSREVRNFFPYKQYFRRRLHRDTNGKINKKPFWEMDNFQYKDPTGIRSIRYTTLGNKRIRTTTTIPTSRPKSKTETITVKLKGTMRSHKDYISEKYLSFEELMHLRRNNPGEHINWRRAEGNETNSKEGKTASEITTNTPFIKKKYCTRKLTCTWTAYTGDDKNNNIGPGEHGSKTPPGYVDGCTRTSTCTREFMNRNKISTVQQDSTLVEQSETTAEDEDYCEKRSLDVGGHNCARVPGFSQDYQEIHSFSPLMETTFTDSLEEECSCKDDNLRTKREIISQSNYNQSDMSEVVIPNCNLFSTVFHKLIYFWTNESKPHAFCKCLCNGQAKIKIMPVLLLCTIIKSGTILR